MLRKERSDEDIRLVSRLTGSRIVAADPEAQKRFHFLTGKLEGGDATEDEQTEFLAMLGNVTPDISPKIKEQENDQIHLVSRLSDDLE